MLSYQHSYHAGSRADIHKHNIFSRALEHLCKGAPITCIETHAGRGLYDLQSPEAKKTGEAAHGWLTLLHDKNFLATLSPSYVSCIQKLNKGRLSSFYPGSPTLAAHILRKEDKLHLMELHPTEYAALKLNISKDRYASLQKRDGLEGALEVAPGGEKPGIVLIDPSYEVKSEYAVIPEFVLQLRKAWPGAAILIWAPMLPALRYEGMIENLKKAVKDIQISETTWAKPGEVRGMYGSVMVGVNMPAGFVF